MSGTATFISPYNLGNLLAPVNGTTHGVKFNISLAANSCDISIASIRQQINLQPQSMWVNNNANVADVLITETIFGWSQIIPAGQSIWFNFPSVPNPNFVFSSAGTVTAAVAFFDFPALPSTINQVTNQTPPSVNIANQPVGVEIFGLTSATAYADNSVVATGASQALLAANASRKYLLIGAPTAVPVWFNPTGGVAGPQLTGCFQIAAGGSYESGFTVPSNAITVYCSMNGAVIPCTSA